MDLVPSPTCCPRHSCHIWTLGDACPLSPTEGCRCPDRTPKKDWRWSEKDLRVRLAESRWQRAELAGHLRVALEALSKQAQVLQRREQELGLSQACCELLAQKQKVECSLACLEQERHQLQGPQGHEEWRRPDQAIEDRILLLQAEVEKAWRRLNEMSQQPLSPEPTLREMAVQVQEQRWDGHGAQVLQDSAGVSMGAAEAPAQPQDITFLQEQLAVVTQVNKRLSEELGQSHQRLRACQEQLQLLQGEQMVSRSRVQALEAECTRLLGEKSVLLAALGVAPSQEACTPQVQEVPVTLRKELEEGDSHPRLGEEAAEYWKARWHRVALALKFKEEELQRLQRQSGVWPPQTPQRPARDPAGPRASVSSREMGQQLKRALPKPQPPQHLPEGDPDTATERQECPREEWPDRSRGQALEKKNDLKAAEIQRWKELEDKGFTLQGELEACWQELDVLCSGYWKLRCQLLEAHGPVETPGRLSESMSGSLQELPERRPAVESESPGWALPVAEGSTQDQAGVELLRPPAEELEELSLRPNGEEKAAGGGAAPSMVGSSAWGTGVSATSQLLKISATALELEERCFWEKLAARGSAQTGEERRCGGGGPGPLGTRPMASHTGDGELWQPSPCPWHPPRRSLNTPSLYCLKSSSFADEDAVPPWREGTSRDVLPSTSSAQGSWPSRPCLRLLWGLPSSYITSSSASTDPSRAGNLSQTRPMGPSWDH